MATRKAPKVKTTKPEAAEKPAVAKPRAAAGKKPARKKAKAGPGDGPSAEQRIAMVAHAAYMRAEKRGFEAGHELDDWLAAVAEVDAQLAGTGLT